MSGAILPILPTRAKCSLPASRAIRRRHPAHRIEQLDDDVLARQPPVVSGPYYVTLHGHIQHGIYHAGPISLMRRQP